MYSTKHTFCDASAQGRDGLELRCSAGEVSELKEVGATIYYTYRRCCIDLALVELEARRENEARSSRDSAVLRSCVLIGIVPMLFRLKHIKDDFQRFDDALL